jgi:protein phosphatase 2C family protein 2/3
VLALTQDHRPSDPEETKYVVSHGGKVVLDKINGRLDTSRSLGDFVFKVLKYIKNNIFMYIRIF